MTDTTYVIARNPVDPLALFDAARKAAGDPKRWTLFDGPDFGDVHMYQTRSGQGAAALVSVHFPAAGGPYPREDGNPKPDGYAHVGFLTSGDHGIDDVRGHHAGLVAELGRWLDAHAIGWCWSFDGEPWIHGHVPTARPGTAPATAPELGRRTARTAAAPAPGQAWIPLIAATGAFDPEDDTALLGWMSGEAGGMAGYAEAIAAAYDTATTVIGLDPAALQALHDCADAAAGAAEQMAVARQRFTAHYAEVRQFAASGGVLPFNGRWMTGEGS
jgi:hypothetical protein